MAKIPRRIMDLLDKRRKLSQQLRSVCCEIDDYCERIGMDICDPENALCSDVRIYCEADGAYDCTLRAIGKALEKGGIQNADKKLHNKG